MKKSIYINTALHQPTGILFYTPHRNRTGKQALALLSTPSALEDLEAQASKSMVQGCSLNNNTSNPICGVETLN